MKMTLHRALAQRKVTKARLQKEIESSMFIATTVGTTGKVDGIPVADTEKNIRGNYDRIVALKKNLQVISNAINRANNGITDDTVGISTVDFLGGKATLSSILVAQEDLRCTKFIIEVMTKQLSKAKNAVSRSEMNVNERCDAFLSSMGGGDSSKLSASDIDAYSRSFHENNDLKLVDPLHLEVLIESLKQDAERLDIEADSKISEINAMVTIEIPD